MRTMGLTSLTAIPTSSRRIMIDTPSIRATCRELGISMLRQVLQISPPRWMRVVLRKPSWFKALAPTPTTIDMQRMQRAKHRSASSRPAQSMSRRATLSKSPTNGFEFRACRAFASSHSRARGPHGWPTNGLSQFGAARPTLMRTSSSRSCPIS